MGNTIANIYKKLFDTSVEARVLMLGLDGAGKTTIGNKLAYDASVATIPTIGFNMESLKINNVDIALWDIGGQTKIRALWSHYYPNTDAIIFVVDSTDKKRIKETRSELSRLLEHEDLSECAVLVFANKQDLGVMGVNEVVEAMGLRELRGRDWYCQGCSALTGTGLFEGFAWLSKTLKKRKNQ